MKFSEMRDRAVSNGTPKGPFGANRGYQAVTVTLTPENSSEQEFVRLLVGRNLARNFDQRDSSAVVVIVKA